MINPTIDDPAPLAGLPDQLIGPRLPRSGKAEPRPTEMDLYPIIVQQGFRNTPDDQTAVEQLISWLKVHGTPGMVSFAWKNRAKLRSVVDDVWKWESVDKFLGEYGLPRFDRFLASAQSPCCCGGQWRARAEHALQLNGINKGMFCSDVMLLLHQGRGEHVPVMVLMGRFGGEGKSFILSPLRAMYGTEHVQATPQKGSFPLLGLETKKICLLDDWCFNEKVLSLPTQLLWYEGKAFPLPQPQNSGTVGHVLYQGKAPVFATGKEKDLGPVLQKAAADAQSGAPSEWTMLLRRLRVYSFCCRLPVRPAGAPKIPECACCFAQMCLQHGRRPEQ